MSLARRMISASRRATSLVVSSLRLSLAPRAVVRVAPRASLSHAQRAVLCNKVLHATMPNAEDRVIRNEKPLMRVAFFGAFLVQLFGHKKVYKIENQIFVDYSLRRALDSNCEAIEPIPQKTSAGLTCAINHILSAQPAFKRESVSTQAFVVMFINIILLLCLEMLASARHKTKKRPR